MLRMRLGKQFPNLLELPHVSKRQVPYTVLSSFLSSSGSFYGHLEEIASCYLIEKGFCWKFGKIDE